MAPNTLEYKSSLSEEDWKFLRDNGKYSETDDSRSKAVQELQEWLQENPHIAVNTNPRHLVRFLRHSKYQLDICKKRIENFSLLRSQVPEWYQNRDISERILRDLLELGPFLPLLKKDASKRTTILIRPTVHDPYIVSQNDLMKLYNMVFDLAMEQDETVNIYGVNVLVDLKHMRIGHIHTPGNIKKAVHSWQDCYPLSPKSFDFIYAPKFVDIALDLFRRFLSPKLKTRVHIHGKDLESLHAIVPPEILPEEYGGTAGTVQELTDHWTQEVLKAKDWYLEEDKIILYNSGSG